MCVRSARAEPRHITIDTRTQARQYERGARARTHPNYRTRARKMRRVAYCACVARFTSSPTPRRRNRPGISLSLVLALSNVVRCRRQLREYYNTDDDDDDDDDRFDIVKI